MSDQLIYQAWVPDTIPATINVWGREVGRLIGGGTARFLWQGEYFCPHLVTVGHGRIRTAHGEWPVHAGDAFCLWPGQFIEYAQVPGEPWEFHWICLDGTGCEEYARTCGFQPDQLVAQPALPHQAIRIIQQLHAYYTQPAEARESYHALSLLFDFAASCRQPQPASNPANRLALLAQEAEAAIQSLLHTGINVAELAQLLGVSRITLLRAFTAYIGISPQRYLLRSRMQAAKALLQHTEAPLTTIAAATGFANDKYFINCFHREEGMTPGEWRRRQ
jgi:AraC-like DNA-binding protein